MCSFGDWRIAASLIQKACPAYGLPAPLRLPGTVCHIRMTLTACSTTCCGRCMRCAIYTMVRAKSWLMTSARLFEREHALINERTGWCVARASIRVHTHSGIHPTHPARVQVSCGGNLSAFISVPPDYTAHTIEQMAWAGLADGFDGLHVKSPSKKFAIQFAL